MKEATKKAKAAGLNFRKSGAHVPASTIYKILRNRIYTGQFDWNGKLYQGKHEPLVSLDLWERAQAVMNGRYTMKSKQGRRDFAFSGLIACAQCGCAVVGEIKKERYVYYHCTGYADKCRGNPGSCRRRYVREEVIGRQFTELLGRLHFDEEVLEWVRAIERGRSSGRSLLISPRETVACTTPDKVKPRLSGHRISHPMAKAMPSARPTASIIPRSP